MTVLSYKKGWFILCTLHIWLYYIIKMQERKEASYKEVE